MDFYWPAWLMIVGYLAGALFSAILAVFGLIPRFAKDYKHPLRMFLILVLRAFAELLIGLYFLNLLKTEQLNSVWIFSIVLIFGLTSSAVFRVAENIGKPVLP